MEPTPVFLSTTGWSYLSCSPLHPPTCAAPAILWDTPPQPPCWQSEEQWGQAGHKAVREQKARIASKRTCPPGRGGSRVKPFRATGTEGRGCESWESPWALSLGSKKMHTFFYLSDFLKNLILILRDEKTICVCVRAHTHVYTQIYTHICSFVLCFKDLQVTAMEPNLKTS